jgi:hypothetical protein
MSPRPLETQSICGWLRMIDAQCTLALELSKNANCLPKKRRYGWVGAGPGLAR